MTVHVGETRRLKVSVEDEDGKPVCPTPDAVSFQVYDGETFVDDEAEMTLVEENQANVTAATGSTLTDAGKAWRIDQWRDYVVRLTSGLQAGEERRILSNTATTLTLDSDQVVNAVPIGDLDPAPSVADTFSIHRSRFQKDWVVAEELEGKTAKVLFRAEVTGDGSYVALEAIRFRVEVGET